MDTYVPVVQDVHLQQPINADSKHVSPIYTLELICVHERHFTAGMHPGLDAQSVVEPAPDTTKHMGRSNGLLATSSAQPTLATPDRRPAALLPLVLASTSTSTETTAPPEGKPILTLADLVRFVPLIEALKESKRAGRESPNWGVAATLTKKRSGSAFPRGQFRLYLEEAQKAGIVAYAGDPQQNDDFVRLRVQDIQSAVEGGRFKPLIQVLRDTRAMGGIRSSWAETANKIKNLKTTAFPKGHFQEYVQAAVEAGLVTTGGEAMEKWIQLVDVGNVRV